MYKTRKAYNLAGRNGLVGVYSDVYTAAMFGPRCSVSTIFTGPVDNTIKQLHKSAAKRYTHQHAAGVQGRHDSRVQGRVQRATALC